MTIYFGDGSDQPVSGKIIQVVQHAKRDTFSGQANTSEISVTGLAATITPKFNDSKIMVCVNINFSCTSTTYAMYVKRGSTLFGRGTASGSRQQAIIGLGHGHDDNQQESASMNYIDSPATTSAITYQVFLNNDNARDIHINRSVNDGDNVIAKRLTSTVTLFELERCTTSETT